MTFLRRTPLSSKLNDPESWTKSIWFIGVIFHRSSSNGADWSSSVRAKSNWWRKSSAISGVAVRSSRSRSVSKMFLEINSSSSSSSLTLDDDWNDRYGWAWRANGKNDDDNRSDRCCRSRWHGLLDWTSRLDNLDKGQILFFVLLRLNNQSSNLPSEIRSRWKSKPSHLTTGRNSLKVRSTRRISRQKSSSVRYLSHCSSMFAKLDRYPPMLIVDIEWYLHYSHSSSFVDQMPPNEQTHSCSSRNRNRSSDDVASKLSNGEEKKKNAARPSVDISKFTLRRKDEEK